MVFRFQYAHLRYSFYNYLSFFVLTSWHIIMRMRSPKEGSCDPIAPLELPHSLHAFHRVSKADRLNMVYDLVLIFLMS